MTKEEIALQLTLKAIESKSISFQGHTNFEDKELRRKSFLETADFNAKLIYEFYNAIFDNLK